MDKNKDFVWLVYLRGVNGDYVLVKIFSEKEDAVDYVESREDFESWRNEDKTKTSINESCWCDIEKHKVE